MAFLCDTNVFQRRMEVQIPSPSVFLQKSPLIKPVTELAPLKKSLVKPRNASDKTSSKAATASTAVHDGAITKPKQSKSRNGKCSHIPESAPH